MSSTKLGKDAIIYINTGSYAAPTWTEGENVKDVDLSLEKEKTDVTRRGSGSWKKSKTTWLSGSVNFDIIADGTDTFFTTVRDAFLNATAKEFLVVDGAYNVVGHEGLRATCEITKFARSEKLSDPVTYSITIEPTDADNEPEWVQTTTSGV